MTAANEDTDFFFDPVEIERRGDELLVKDFQLAEDSLRAYGIQVTSLRQQFEQKAGEADLDDPAVGKGETDS